MPVVQLAPHAGLSSNHIDSCHSWIESVDFPPVYECSIGKTVFVAKSFVNIGQVLKGKYDFIGPTWDAIQVTTPTPPVNHIVFLNWEIELFVGPVDNLFRWYSSPQLFLPVPVMNLQLPIRSNSVLEHPLQDVRFQVPANRGYFIPAEVNIAILKDTVSEF